MSLLWVYSILLRLFGCLLTIETNLLVVCSTYLQQQHRAENTFLRQFFSVTQHTHRYKSFQSKECKWRSVLSIRRTKLLLHFKRLLMSSVFLRMLTSSLIRDGSSRKLFEPRANRVIDCRVGSSRVILRFELRANRVEN